MNISKLSLLLLVPFLSITNDKSVECDNLISTDELEEVEIIDFNTLVLGSGNPTVIFESGLGTPLNNWANIQESISANYKTVTYDRKGIGGTPDTEDPRTIENLVKDLDAMIAQNEIEGPIVLVGHSLGGHIVRKYQQLYPSKVAGLFLIDPTNEYLYEEVFKQMPPAAVDSMKTAWDNSFKNWGAGVYNEWKEAYKNDLDMRNCPLPTNIPITILASHQESTFLTKKNLQIKKRVFSEWITDKENVQVLSTTNSGHYIHSGEPEWVIRELEKFLEEL